MTNSSPIRSGSLRAWLPIALGLLVISMSGQGASSSPKARAGTPAPARTYATKFPLSENPVSENGNWINGKSAGLDWADVASTPGLAYGTEIGSAGYDDATAVLSGGWAPDQTVEATLHAANQNTKAYEEVELRLRSSITAHRITGYEINFRCAKGIGAYSEIVRWNGAFGDFTYLSQHQGAKYGIADGDVVKATIVGNAIAVFINGVQVNQATDSTFASGSPGMGFFLQGAKGVNQDYGFSSFTASEGVKGPATPANLAGTAR